VSSGILRRVENKERKLQPRRSKHGEAVAPEYDWIATDEG